MNTFASSRSGAEAVAHYLIRERVQDAESRTQRRAARAARRAVRRLS